MEFVNLLSWLFHFAIRQAPQNSQQPSLVTKQNLWPMQPKWSKQQPNSSLFSLFLLKNASQKTPMDHVSKLGTYTSLAGVSQRGAWQLAQQRRPRGRHQAAWPPLPRERSAGSAWPGECHRWQGTRRSRCRPSLHWGRGWLGHRWWSCCWGRSCWHHGCGQPPQHLQQAKSNSSVRQTGMQWPTSEIQPAFGEGGGGGGGGGGDGLKLQPPSGGNGFNVQYAFLFFGGGGGELKV